MNRTTHSIFTPTELTTFAVPTEIFDKLLLSDTGASAVLVYLYILRRAESGGPIVRIHTGDALNDIGISRPVFYEARNALAKAKLIRARETDKQGVWHYEIRDGNGRKLPTFDDYVVFADLTSAQLEAYYADRLGINRAPGQDTSGNPLFACPFHSSHNNRPTLRVTVDNAKHHGRYICGDSRKCGKRGGLVDFEMAIASQKGRNISKREAASAVRAFMLSNANVEPHPAVADLLESPSSVVL